jgi:hypothetical protein
LFKSNNHVKLFIEKGELKMPKRKYAKYLLPAPIMMMRSEINGKTTPGYNFKSLWAHKGELNADFTLSLNYMNEPYKEVYPHTHEGHEILCFVGGNPQNFEDFDAEIELAFGEEEEVYTITSPTVVSIPAGLVHGPLAIKRAGKPVLFIEVTHVPQGKYKLSTEGEHGKKRSEGKKVNKKISE